MKKMNLAHVSRGKFALGLLVATLGLTMAAGPGEVSAAYPTKPIRMLVGFRAGGATDLLGRLVAKGLEKELGVPVVVTNKGGAGGALAYNEVRRARPDGYTLGWVTGSLFTTTNIGNVKWDYKALDSVARIAQWPMVVGTRAKAPWKSWKEFLADAKRNPGKYKFGHAGTGSIGHLMNVAVSSGVKVIMAPVGVRGRFSALLGAKIDLLSAPAAGFVKFSKAGKMRALVVGSAKRVRLLSKAPTAKEIGIDFQVDLMYGVFAPPGTSGGVKGKLRAALTKVVANYKPIHKFAKTKKMNLEYLDGTGLDRWLGEQNATVVRIMKKVGLYKSRMKKN